jgi:23S rRNA (cytidine2498-2'-O)-methyltransferase
VQGSGAAGERILLSASEEYLATAIHEVRDLLGGAAERLGPDCALVEGVPLTAVAAACRDGRVAFVRHLAAVRAQLDPSTDLATIAAAARGVVRSHAPPDEPSVQVWTSGAVPGGPGSAAVAAAVRDAWAEPGGAPASYGREHVLSVCLTRAGVVLGLNRTVDGLSDWPGGRVRLAKRQGQVSRAEFKLEELFQVLALDLPAAGSAVDLGAAPGGWTRILRLRGLQVWAIDPGDMDPRVAADPGVHHVRTTAGEFFRATSHRFDLAVNDMRMDPQLSCRVMLEVAERLRSGALAIVTLKVGVRRPLETLRRCRALLEERYDTVFVRQLQHNRHELTAVVRRRSKR